LRHFYGGARTRLFAVVIAAILVPATILLALFVVAGSMETAIAVVIFDATLVWWHYHGELLEMLNLCCH
jgi:hypothetical protein